MTVLDLAPYLIRPGNRVIVREAERNRALKAHAKAETARLRTARTAFAGEQG